MAAVTAVSQMIQLLAQPLLARLYAPEYFGAMAQVLSFSTILSIICTLQIHNYLSLIKDDRKKLELFSFGLQWATVGGLILALLICAIPDRLFAVSESRAMAVLVATLTLALSYANLLKGLVVAKSGFGTLARYTVLRSISVISAQVMLASAFPHNGLIYGLILGEILSQLFLIGIKEFRGASFTPVLDFFQMVGRQLKAHYNFMVVGTIQELFAVAVFMMPLYWVGRLYGVMDGGQFALAQRMSWAPALVLTQAISSVLYKHFSDQARHDLFASKLNSLPYVLLALLILAVPVGVCAKPVFLMAFGEVWHDAAEMSGWVAMWALTFLFAFPCRLSYRVLGLQRWQLLIDFLVLAVMLLLCALHKYMDALGFVIGISVIGMLQNIGLLMFLSWQGRRVGN